MLLQVEKNLREVSAELRNNETELNFSHFMIHCTKKQTVFQATAVQEL
jgi:hypothetical protein